MEESRCFRPVSADVIQGDAVVCLVVDDNAQFRELVVSMMRSHFDKGMQCYECGSGREALESYERLQPDVVLMDVRLGDRDGISVTREIRHRHPDATVLILSQYDEETLSEEAKTVGASAYILKEHSWKAPFVIEHLLWQKKK